MYIETRSRLLRGSFCGGDCWWGQVNQSDSAFPFGEFDLNALRIRFLAPVRIYGAVCVNKSDRRRYAVYDNRYTCSVIVCGMFKWWVGVHVRFPTASAVRTQILLLKRRVELGRATSSRWLFAILMTNSCKISDCWQLFWCLSVSHDQFIFYCQPLSE